MSKAGTAERHFKAALAEAEKRGDAMMIDLLKGLVALAQAVKLLPS